jgi:S-DNA-T family DNA segregation ATPase FtsK/SpoIIIE
MATKRTNTAKLSLPQDKQKSPSSQKQMKIDFSFDILQDNRTKKALGILLTAFCVTMFFSLFSYLINGTSDQSIVEALWEANLVTQGIETENWFGLLGAVLGYIFIYRGFGIASFLILIPLSGVAYKILKKIPPFDLSRWTKISFYAMFWLSLLLGYIVLTTKATGWFSFICGGIGYNIAYLFDSLVGWGTIVFIVAFAALFRLYFFRDVTLEDAKNIVKQQVNNIENKVEQIKKEVSGSAADFDEKQMSDDFETKTDIPTHSKYGVADKEADDDNLTEHNTPVKSVISQVTPSTGISFQIDNESNLEDDTIDLSESSPDENSMPTVYEHQTAIDAAKTQQAIISADLSDPDHVQPTEDYLYDPTLELGSYKFPTIDLLNDTGDHKVEISKEELEGNINQIVSILKSFKVDVILEQTKVTVGPTVTLYQIVPAEGVKISKIKSLEDDIALKLAALGIRIIAPIPGAGTIGIEVPNRKKKMVTIHSILSTKKYQETDKDLPIAFGRTISNEVFIADLAKMPHLLVAGATGQGKSVGINVILASLLYKKHPAEIKFVLIDPKKVEMALFEKIERHFLAALPDAEEPIITDVKKAVGVLNSLCIEMDNRYNLLKNAGVRNIKEYNEKFINRRLNPNKGHRYLPYIVLIIDELADLMMTAGKEVEYPIARIAQLARAIGIHMVVATQRPSVDVITGMIKANFPARLSFRVTSKIDSRTILDSNGADQLIGQGDMLLSNGSEIIRVQCAYIATDEVEKICDYIGGQRGYETAYLLPEYTDEDSVEQKDVDMSKIDPMFAEAARIIVTTQQGSTSILQRKLGLGYARAGKITDQLEAAGIVGHFEGNKARQVLVQDILELEQILSRYVK